ncbi:hypothetical protein DM450_25420 (plasmid) [Sphingomonas sp. IC081]|nr:hypothetical protein DM450_25420 [Sphingomonas sp. IC081]
MIDDITLGIGQYVSGVVEQAGRLGEREFYAHAFGVWMFSCLGKSFDRPRHRLLDAIHANGDAVSDHHPTKFHWEFVRFALEKAKVLGGLEPYHSVTSLLGGKRFANVPVANWTLLRAAARAAGSPIAGALAAHAERGLALLYFQGRHGFIEDRRHAPTAQYHAFSTALVGMQVMASGLARRMHLAAFLKAIGALERIMLPSGDMNVFGRGAKQSFGYAAATLGFAQAYALTGDERYLACVRRVVRFLADAQRADGSLPLVLGGHETCRGELVDLDDPRFAGWYIYNNYFDYLCFTGALLAEARAVLARTSHPVAPSPAPQADACVADNILRISRPLYSALVLPPATGTADSLPLPFLEIAGRQPLPCYGGENYPNQLYRLEGLPLPRLIAPDGTSKMLFEPRAYRWTGDRSFSGSGDGWRLTRHFLFEDDHFTVQDELHVDARHAGWALFSPRILMMADCVEQDEDGALRAPGLRIASERPLTAETDEQWCARGRLIAYSNPTTIPSEGLSQSATITFDIDGKC